MAEDDGFLSRWSRRKVQVQQGLAVEPERKPEVATLELPPVAALRVVAEPVAATAAVPEDPPPPSPPQPTLEEAQRLTTADDFTRFVGRGVDPQVKNTALRTLFSDPHFNVMDGLDTYIDDYGKPDPLPPGMLRQMVQSAMLGLFDGEPKDNPPPAALIPDPIPALPPATPPDEDLALRLQPNDDAGPAGDRQGVDEDAGRQL
jgi:hypothetical protein